MLASYFWQKKQEHFQPSNLNKIIYYSYLFPTLSEIKYKIHNIADRLQQSLTVLRISLEKEKIPCQRRKIEEDTPDYAKSYTIKLEKVTHPGVEHSI